ncbi:MAG TPA: hypothetical protein VEY69_08580, partial [Lautropia sp.]|nr:hypothetical protein [Lautropia sp.]
MTNQEQTNPPEGGPVPAGATVPAGVPVTGNPDPRILAAGAPGAGGMPGAEGRPEAVAIGD